MFEGTYGGTLPSDLDVKSDEVLKFFKEKKVKEPYPGYTMFGNGKETRKGGASMDILDICKELNKGEMNLMQFFRDEFEKGKMRKELNPLLIVPTRSDDITDYLTIALKKNYPHMNCLGITRRVKRGTYMLNPYLFIPPGNMEALAKEWNELDDSNCDDKEEE